MLWSKDEENVDSFEDIPDGDIAREDMADLEISIDSDQEEGTVLDII